MKLPETLPDVDGLETLLIERARECRAHIRQPRRDRRGKLFGSADQKIFILNWAAQIDTEADAATTFTAFEEMAKNYVPDVPFLGNQIHLLYLGLACRLTLSLLSDLADTQGEVCHYNDLALLALLENIYTPDTEVFLRDKRVKEIPVRLDGGYVRTESIYFYRLHEYRNAADHLTQWIISELMTLFPHQARLTARCEECLYPFLRDSRHEDQRYCSQRCRQRVWTRGKRSINSSMNRFVEEIKNKITST